MEEMGRIRQEVIRFLTFGMILSSRNFRTHYQRCFTAFMTDYSNIILDLDVLCEMRNLVYEERFLDSRTIVFINPVHVLGKETVYKKYIL